MHLVTDDIPRSLSASFTLLGQGKMTGISTDSNSPSETIKEVVEERLDEKGNRVKVVCHPAKAELCLDHQKNQDAAGE